jgi:hypothetical protein
MAPSINDISNFPTLTPGNDDSISSPPTMAPDGDGDGDSDDNSRSEDDDDEEEEDHDDGDGDDKDGGDDSVKQDDDQGDDDDDDSDDDNSRESRDDRNDEDDDDEEEVFVDDSLVDDQVAPTDDGDDAVDDGPMGNPNRGDDGFDDGFDDDGMMSPFSNRPNQDDGGFDDDGTSPFPTDDQFVFDDDQLDDSVGNPFGPNQEGDNGNDAVGATVGTSNDDFVLNTDDLAAAPAYQCPSGWTGPSCDIPLEVGSIQRSGQTLGFGCPSKPPRVGPRRRPCGTYTYFCHITYLTDGKKTVADHVVSPSAGKNYRPVLCGVANCQYDNHCLATVNGGFQPSECKLKSPGFPRRMSEVLSQGAYSKLVSSYIKNNEGRDGNASLSFREEAMEGPDGTLAAGNNNVEKTPRVHQGVGYSFVDEGNDDDTVSTADNADTDDSTQTDDADDRKMSPPQDGADNDDLVQPDHSSTGSEDDDSFQPEQGTSTGFDDGDDDTPLQPDHGTFAGDDDDAPAQPDHDTNSAADDDAPAPPDHGESAGDDNDDAPLQPAHGKSDGDADDDAPLQPDHGKSDGDADDDDDATIEPENGSVPEGSGGMSAFVTIALVIVAMSGLLVAWRKLMLWRLERIHPLADMPIWVRDTELETYNDHPEDKYSSDHGARSNENERLAFPSEESTRPASRLDRFPNFAPGTFNGANDIC